MERDFAAHRVRQQIHAEAARGFVLRLDERAQAGMVPVEFDFDLEINTYSIDPLFN